VNPGPAEHTRKENQLTHDHDKNPPFSVHNIIEPEPHKVAVLDWFILEGADHDETQFGLEAIDGVTLDDIEYYFGDPTENFHHYIFEVTALAVLGAPFDTDTVREIVAPVADGLDGHDYEVEVTNEVDLTVWVTCRLAEVDLAPDRLGARLGELVTLAKRVRALVAS